MTNVVDLWYLLGNLHRKKFQKNDSPTPSRPADNNEKHTIQWSHKPSRVMDSRYCAMWPIAESNRTMLAETKVNTELINR